MSNYLSGIHFKNAFVRPIQDASILATVLTDGIVDGWALTFAGSTLHVAPGRMIICGRGCYLPAALDLAVTGASSGYARLVLSVDLTASDDPASFRQLPLTLEYAATLGGFDSLTRQDVNNGGALYQLVICVMALGDAGITGIVSTCGHAHGRAAGVVVDLPAASWSNGVQTVRVDGVHADTQVIASENPDYSDEFDAADIRLVGQAEGTITLRCKGAVPTALVRINVFLA